MMRTTITMDDYCGALRRDRDTWREFNEWLVAIGVDKLACFELSIVGEGWLKLRCYKLDAEGHVFDRDATRIVHLTARIAPPPSLMQFLSD